MENTGTSATTYTDDGSIAELEAGVKRHYRVSAINSVGRSVSLPGGSVQCDHRHRCGRPGACRTGQRQPSREWHGHDGNLHGVGTRFRNGNLVVVGRRR